MKRKLEIGLVLASVALASLAGWIGLRSPVVPPAEDSQIEQLTARITALEAEVKWLQQEPELPVVPAGVWTTNDPYNSRGGEEADIPEEPSAEAGAALPISSVDPEAVGAPTHETMSMAKLTAAWAQVAENTVSLEFSHAVSKADAGKISISINGNQVTAPMASVDSQGENLILHLPPGSLFKGARVGISWDEFLDGAGMPVVGQARAVIAE